MHMYYVLYALVFTCMHKLKVIFFFFVSTFSISVPTYILFIVVSTVVLVSSLLFV